MSQWFWGHEVKGHTAHKICANSISITGGRITIRLGNCICKFILRSQRTDQIFRVMMLKVTGLKTRLIHLVCIIMIISLLSVSNSYQNKNLNFKNPSRKHIYTLYTINKCKKKKNIFRNTDRCRLPPNIWGKDYIWLLWGNRIVLVKTKRGDHTLYLLDISSLTFSGLVQKILGLGCMENTC